MILRTLMQKRQSSENKYGRLFFVGSPEAVREMKAALHDDKIVISRGKQLENLLNELMGKVEDIEQN